MNLEKTYIEVRNERELRIALGIYHKAGYTWTGGESLMGKHPWLTGAHYPFALFKHGPDSGITWGYVGQQKATFQRINTKREIINLFFSE